MKKLLMSLIIIIMTLPAYSQFIMPSNEQIVYDLDNDKVLFNNTSKIVIMFDDDIIKISDGSKYKVLSFELKEGKDYRLYSSFIVYKVQDVNSKKITNIVLSTDLKNQTLISILKEFNILLIYKIVNYGQSKNTSSITKQQFRWRKQS